jgi:hypothetical protein
MLLATTVMKKCEWESGLPALARPLGVQDAPWVRDRLPLVFDN